MWKTEEIEEVNILSVLIRIKRGKGRMKIRWQPKKEGEKMRSHVFRNGTVGYVELFNYVPCLSIKQIFCALPSQEILLLVPVMGKGQCITPVKSRLKI